LPKGRRVQPDSFFAPFPDRSGMSYPQSKQTTPSSGPSNASFFGANPPPDLAPASSDPGRSEPAPPPCVGFPQPWPPTPAVQDAG
jgi:hypothetical protein